MYANRVREVYKRLAKCPDLDVEGAILLMNIDPFKLLVATILSQNTNDRNSMRAYMTLEERVGINVDDVLRASVDEIKEAIKVAGLYNVKAVKIKELAKVLKERYGGTLEWINDRPAEEARKELLGLPGVGEKTADVVLLYFRKCRFPVDTHIKRISTRLGIVRRNASYDEISCAWMSGLRCDEYLDAHLRLIAFGRTVCKTRPRCHECVLNDICETSPYVK